MYLTGIGPGMKGTPMICQHGIDTHEYICPECEAALARFRELTAAGVHTKETNEAAIALELSRQENDRIFGTRWR